jgi:small subunit ribosomal protein S29
MLSQIAKANHTVLSKMRLSKQYKLSVPVQSNISLDRLAMMGAQDPDIAWEIYETLWSELTAPSQEGQGLARPPVVFTVDSISHVMRNSAYLNVDVQPIHAHDLSIVSHFLKLLAAKKPLPNGGMVLGIDSASNRPGVPGFDFAVARNAAIAQNKTVPEWDPWAKVDQRSIDCMAGVDVWQIKGLSREEARSIMEYYAKSGMLRQIVNDNLVGEKWTLSGGGIIGELEKGTVRTRI